MEKALSWASFIVSSFATVIISPFSLSTLTYVKVVGENDTNIRKLICNRLKDAFGIVLDEEINSCSRGKEILLSKPESKIQVWLIPTNEELMIARDTYRLIGE